MGKRVDCKIDHENRLKECSTCREMKSFDLFYKNAKLKSGLFSECKACAQAKKESRRPKKEPRIDYEKDIKLCVQCKEMKSFTEFNKDKRAKSGLSSYCKDCIRLNAGKKKRYVPEVDEDNKLKKCRICEKFKSFDEFFKREDTGKLRNECKTCLRIQKGGSEVSRKDVDVDYDNETKRCSKCKEMVPWEDYYKAQGKLLGLNSSCKSCASISTGHTPRKKMFVDPDKRLKQCRTCEETKSFDEFYKDSSINHGLSTHCIECVKKDREDNIEKYREADKRSYRKNVEKRRKNNKKWHRANRDLLNAYHKKRIKENPNFRISNYVRSRTINALKGRIKPGSITKNLGCSFDFLREYLEERFYDRKNGEKMTWENHGFYGWHIDHIIPLSSFDLTDLEQFKKAVHYTNLQPLWAEDNLAKGDRYDASSSRNEQFISTRSSDDDQEER